MNPAKTGISRLLIASAIDPDVYRRLLESPEETFDEFDLNDSAVGHHVGQADAEQAGQIHVEGDNLQAVVDHGQDTPYH